jgi:hypothetical protein
MDAHEVISSNVWFVKACSEALQVPYEEAISFANRASFQPDMAIGFSGPAAPRQDMPMNRCLACFGEADADGESFPCEFGCGHLMHYNCLVDWLRLHLREQKLPPFRCPQSCDCVLGSDLVEALVPEFAALVREF